jgi:multiple sugar transport system substrate-binding protein
MIDASVSGDGLGETAALGVASLAATAAVATKGGSMSSSDHLPVPTDRAHDSRVSRRRFIGLAAGATLAAGRSAVAASGPVRVAQATSAPGRKVTIRVQDWHLAEKVWGAFERQMVEDFKKANPSVEVELDAVPYGETLNKFLAQTKASQPADVVYAADAHTVQYLEAGYILDLAPHMKGDRDFAVDKFNGAAMRSVTRGDKVFAVPNAATPVLLHYNTEMFQKAGLDPSKPPRTWEEFQDATIKLTRKDPSGRTVQWGYAPHGKKVIGNMYRLINWFWENDADILTPDQKAAALNSPAGVEAFTFLVELGTKHKVFPPQATDIDPGGARSLLAKEQVAVLSGFLGGRAILIGENPAMKTKQAFAPLPTRKKKVNALNTEYWTVSSQSKNPEAAVSFVKFMMSREGQVRMWKAVESIPGRNAAAADSSIEEDKFAKLAVAELANSRSTPLIPQWAQIVDVTLDAFQRALLGQVQPKPALDQAAQQIDSILKR